MTGDSDPILTPLLSEGDRGPEQVTEGTRLGKYEMLKRLSVGGMAEVYLARAAGLPGFQKLLAVKRILPQLAAQPEFVEMFLDEARLAATLLHPNIVQIHDVGVARGNYFMAMEYLHGEDLNTLLRTMKKRGERVPLEHAVQIVLSLLAGLHYAHEKEDFEGKPLEIVHRDVTPANVIVTYEGSVKLLDFGIAHAARSAERKQSGSVRGKVGYMSPEQAQAQPLDRRTDIFAAGIILYELTLVRRLFKGESDYQILHNIINGSISPPHDVDAAYDLELEQIVMRALARDPAERFSTAHAMQKELESFARRRGLFLSPSSLKEWMAGLFGERINAWQKAKAQGKALPEELVITYHDNEGEDPSGPVVLESATASGSASSAASVAPIASFASTARARSRMRSAILAGLSLLAATAVAGTLLWTHHRPDLPAPLPSVIAPPAVAPAAPAPPPSEDSPVRQTVASAPLIAPAPAAPAASGALLLTTHPRGATLILDGKKLDAVSNTTLEAAVGAEHTLVLEKHGYQSAQRKFTVDPGGKRKLVVELSRAESAPSAPAPAPAPAAAAPAAAPPMKGVGLLALTSSPWCSISVDGNDRGQTPMRIEVAAGTHQVRLSNPEYHIQRQITVTVHPGETVRKSLEFTR
jgi:eukaryotic-like serine/threonine-protein kinase